MIAWRPDPATIERAQLTRFLRKTGHADFGSMYRWSIEDIRGFTAEILGFLEVPFIRPWTDIVDLTQGSEWPKWCVGAELNISAACIDPHPPDRVAVIWEGEEGTTRSLSYGELGDKAARVGAGLQSLGVLPGDAVGLHLPMVPETVIALIACARIGAVVVPLFSGYGPSAIESRLRDVNAKVLITADGFPRRGVPVPTLVTAKDAAARCPSVKHLVVVGRLGLGATDAISWDVLVSSASASVHPTSAEDSLIVIYTSGTTGRPKGIQHSHCGFPVKSAQDMTFGFDVTAGTRIGWITDIGWMMGPWLIYGTLILGGTICLYDGAPDFPGPDRMWQFCERHRVEVFGISPTLVRALAVHGTEPVRRHDLSSVRFFGSTGEPWNPDPWWWLFREAGQSRIPIMNYSGGTEISGGILQSNPLLPIKPCGFSAPCPGIAADVVDERGKPVTNSVGELVIRKPWIGMARGFVGDPERYMNTYWSRFPGTWTHGDWAMHDSEGQWFILGRSDDTLKIAGKRVGPAEVESILVSHDAVSEAAVIGVPHEVKGECMVAFCILAPGYIASKELEDDLRDRVGEELGKPLRPDHIRFVKLIPKTRNAKLMRRVIRAAWMGEDPGDITALENPQSVEQIRQARKMT